MRRAAADDGAAAGHEAHPDLAGHVALGVGHEGPKRHAELAEPEAVVGERGEPIGDRALEGEQLARQGQLLERSVRRVEHHGGRRLVDLAALDADEAVLDVVDAADAVGARDAVEPLDQLDAAEAVPVDRDWDALLEADDDLARLPRRIGRVDCPGERVGRRGRPRILEHAGLDRAAPQVDVDAERRARAGRDVDAALARVGELLVACHAHPDPHRRDDAQGRIEGGHRHVETDLVVALAGAAVRDEPAPLSCAASTSSRAMSGRASAVASGYCALVEGAGLECRPDEVGHECRPGVDDDRLPCAAGEGALLDARGIDAAPTSTVSVTTSWPCVSRSHGTATEVSSPPE